MSVKVKDLLKMSRLSQEYGDKVLLDILIYIHPSGYS